MAGREARRNDSGNISVTCCNVCSLAKPAAAVTRQAAWRHLLIYCNGAGRRHIIIALSHICNKQHRRAARSDKHLHAWRRIKRAPRA